MFSAECPHTLSKIYFTTQVFNQYHQEIDIASDECIILEQRGAEIEQIKSLLSNNDFLSAVHLRLIFEKLVLEILKKTDTNYQLQRLPRQTKIILRIIAQAPHMSMTNSFFAEATESSLSLVQKQFRAEIGTSIQKYLKDKVLTLAANELISSSVSIKEISEKYGFCDQFYFSRLFTAHFGITPSQYRKNNKMY